MDEIENARQDYLALREKTITVQLATVGPEGLPEASYAPFVFHRGDYFLFLSDLAAHTQNLKANPDISLLLIEDETGGGNAFARKRITIAGCTEIVARGDALFATVLADFHRRFGKVMELIEPLADFHLFRVHPREGRFVRGFAQAYRLSGEGLGQLGHIDPRQ